MSKKFECLAHYKSFNDQRKLLILGVDSFKALRILTNVTLEVNKQ